MEQGLRFPVRVRPGASRTAVGGRYATDALLVAVSARAADGAANRAVADALAAAFGVRRGRVEIVTGATHRSKTVQIFGEPESLAARLSELLQG